MTSLLTTPFRLLPEMEECAPPPGHLQETTKISWSDEDDHIEGYHCLDAVNKSYRLKAPHRALKIRPLSRSGGTSEPMYTFLRDGRVVTTWRLSHLIWCLVDVAELSLLLLFCLVFRCRRMVCLVADVPSAEIPMESK